MYHPLKSSAPIATTKTIRNQSEPLPFRLLISLPCKPKQRKQNMKKQWLPNPVSRPAFYFLPSILYIMNSVFFQKRPMFHLSHSLSPSMYWPT